MSNRIQALPIKDRLKLVEDLWDSIAAEQEKLPLTKAQKKELDKRLDEYELDGNPGTAADEVLDRIRRTL
jgi:putative addiction module component (TIGR02574 family)